MLNLTTPKSLRQATGEELLLMTLFGSEKLKPRIDHELDRRSLADVVISHAAMPSPFTVMPEYAA